MSTVSDPGNKVLSRAELVEQFGRPRKDKVVFTNGCFDILHRGHVEYLAQSRSFGDRLVIGLNSDDSVRRLKGPGRPVVQADDRAYIIAALECVDAVTFFDEDTPAALIEALVPDVLVKGGDYRPEQVVGRDVVERNGGQLVIVPFIAGRSTTSILDKVRQAPG